MIPVLEAILLFFFYTNVTENSRNSDKIFADLDQQ